MQASEARQVVRGGKFLSHLSGWLDLPESHTYGHLFRLTVDFRTDPSYKDKPVPTF